MNCIPNWTICNQLYFATLETFFFDFQVRIFSCFHDAGNKSCLVSGLDFYNSCSKAELPNPNAVFLSDRRSILQPRMWSYQWWFSKGSDLSMPIFAEENGYNGQKLLWLWSNFSLLFNRPVFQVNIFLGLVILVWV